MKKMISTQGLTFGEFCDENMTRAIKERISPRKIKKSQKYSHIPLFFVYLQSNN